MNSSDYPIAGAETGRISRHPYTDEQLRRSYEGRKVCDAEDLGMGYCGSCPFSTHVAQMNDPESWVHSSFERWMRRSPPLQPEDGKKQVASPALKRTLQRMAKRLRDRQKLYERGIAIAANDEDPFSSNRYEGIMTGTRWAAEELDSLIASL